MVLSELFLSMLRGLFPNLKTHLSGCRLMKPSLMRPWGPSTEVSTLSLPHPASGCSEKGTSFHDGGQVREPGVTSDSLSQEPGLHCGRDADGETTLGRV